MDAQTLPPEATPQPAPAPPAFDAEKRVAQFVALRDKIKAIEEKQKADLAPYKETLEKLKAVLLAHLNSTKQESASTTAGTFYKTDKKSASLEDADAFMRHVIGTEAWDLLDRRANVTAVEDFIKEHQMPPPGVKWAVKQDVGVRRAS